VPHRKEVLHKGNKGRNGDEEAGNVGAGADKSFGINILLPLEQAANEVILDDPKLITFKYTVSSLSFEAFPIGVIG